MKQPPESDAVLRVIDAVLGDMAIQTVTYLGRRREDGDAETFVVQFGEDGRFRLGLPDLTADASIEAVVTEAQVRLTRMLGAPAPMCPRHRHALLPRASAGQLAWVCPDGEWQCPIGDYAELAWPHFELDSLAPILAARLQRRCITGVVTIGVRETARGPVAEFGVPETSVELTRALQDAAAPLPANFHHETRRAIRVSGPPNDRDPEVPAAGG